MRLSSKQLRLFVFLHICGLLFTHCTDKLGNGGKKGGGQGGGSDGNGPNGWVVTKIQTREVEVSVAQGSEISGNLLAEGGQGKLSYSLDAQPPLGTVAIDKVTGIFKYTPNVLKFGDDTFEFWVTDESQQRQKGRVTVHITHVNHPPLASDAQVVLADSLPVNDKLTAWDVDNDSLTFKILEQPENGMVVLLNSATGEYKYTPFFPLYAKSDHVLFSVTDGNVEATATVTFIDDTQASVP